MTFVVNSQSFLKDFDFKVVKFAEVVFKKKTMGVAEKDVLDKYNFRIFEIRTTIDEDGTIGVPYLSYNNVVCKVFFSPDSNIKMVSLSNFNYGGWNKFLADMQSCGYKFIEEESKSYDFVFKSDKYIVNVFPNNRNNLVGLTLEKK